MKQLTGSVPTLADFRAKWLDPAQRGALMKQLRDQQLLPELVQEAAQMEVFDEFDILAAFAYGVAPMTRAQRAAQFADGNPEWLVQLPQPPVKVIRAIVKQFEKAGTAALESNELWQTLGVPNALRELKQGGAPNELLRKTKEMLFAA